MVVLLPNYALKILKIYLCYIIALLYMLVTLVWYVASNDVSELGYYCSMYHTCVDPPSSSIMNKSFPLDVHEGTPLPKNGLREIGPEEKQL